MDRSNFYFIMSGFLSLTLFTAFVVLFFLMILGDPQVKNFALEKSNYISISLDTLPTPTKEIKKMPVIEKVQEEMTHELEVKEIDIGDLFSDVWTKDVKIEKKKEEPIDNKRLELIQKKIKKSTQSTTVKKKEIIENNNVEEIDDVIKKTSSANEVNEYLARIQAIVYKYFHPPMNSEGHSVKVVIELSLYGKVIDFRVLKYSENQALNKECDRLKTRLLGAMFPVNPAGTSSKTVVDITSDK